MAQRKSQGSLVNRRRFLRDTWRGVGAKSVAGFAASAGSVRGDGPEHESVHAWRRFRGSLARGHRASGRVSPRTLPTPRVSGGAPFRSVGASLSTAGCAGSSLAAWPLRRRNLAHSVHVEVDGLRPGRDFFYQFDVRAEESPVGHFRTAPSLDETLDRLRFAFATCQDWPSGHYIAYRDMVENDLDIVLHLGDYTYEYEISGITGRGIPAPAGFEKETIDLETYRLRHTLYKLDPDLQAAHAKFPFGVIWDDHEVQNDYSGLAPEYGSPSPAFTARRAAAYQAYYEHMPIRLEVARTPRPGLQIYRQLQYGRLAEITLLDDRQYRSDNPCGDGEALRCQEALTGKCTMLGREQEKWLSRGFNEGRARWNIVAQQLLIAELEHTLPGYPDEWLLERCVGRLPACADAPADRRRRKRRQKPGLPDRRLAFNLRQRSEGRLQGRGVTGRGSGVRHAGHYHRRRRDAIRAVTTRR